MHSIILACATDEIQKYPPPRPQKKIFLKKMRKKSTRSKLYVFGYLQVG